MSIVVVVGTVGLANGRPGDWRSQSISQLGLKHGGIVCRLKSRSVALFSLFCHPTARVRRGNRVDREFSIDGSHTHFLGVCVCVCRCDVHTGELSCERNTTFVPERRV